MNLYLLRHGIASDPGADPDSDRRLTSEGKRQLLKIGAGLNELGIKFDLILSSPYVRARDTAKLVAGALNCDSVELSESLTPSGRTLDLISGLNHRKPRPEDVLVVGHEPYLSRLISLLLSGHFELNVRVKKAGLCKLKIERLEHGKCARLDFLLTPKQMAAMAHSPTA